MRISKKDKVDVKKFMQEIKANKTNRSYVQTETKAKPLTEVVSYPQQRYVPKYFGLPNQREMYRAPPIPSIPYQDHNRYNFNQQADYRIHHPYSNPYISKRSIHDMMSQQSQHFNIQTPFQHPPQAIMNFSQSYSSPNYFPPYHAQHAQINENNYCQPVLHPKSQIKQIESKEPIKNKQYFSLQKSDKEEQVIPEQKLQKVCTDEEITQSIKKQVKKIQTQNKRSISENKLVKNQESKVQAEAPKKRKPREKKKVVSPKKKVISPKKEEVFIQIETEKKIEPRISSMSISKKFDEIMEREKKKIEEKLQHQRKIKQIMGNYNERIQALGEQYFSKSMVESLNNFKQKVFDLIEKYEEKCDEQFNKKLIF